MSERAERLVEFLQGTCMNTLDSACNELFDVSEDDLTPEELAHIDVEIFNCETCGWWCEICEQSKDGVNCEDCYNDEHGGDDEEDED